MSTDSSAPSDTDVEADQFARICREYEECVSSLDESLERFIWRHPSFRDRVGLYISVERPNPVVRGELHQPATDGKLDTEWDAMVAFGYKLACEQILRNFERNIDGFERDR